MNCTYTVSSDKEGTRLDTLLSEVTGLTRSETQKWIKEGRALLDGKPLKGKYRVTEGETIEYSWEVPEKKELVPQDIPLDILYEDDDMIVINKPRGMVVHPAPGNEDGTLANALLFHCGESLREVGDPDRPGIVHRLDKDTSGVMVAAKSRRGYEVLKKEIGEHTARRTYVTLVHGQMEGDHGVIRFPLGRSKKDRMKWDVEPETGKPAVTHFKVLKFFRKYSLVECRLETGRTHQIRVHMAHIKHPVVNDPLYGWKKDQFPIAGQALHSISLDLVHPVTGKPMHFEAPLPEDMKECIKQAEDE
jgi:23S rRNA pseudouridine1911/1915/1917 synthase